MLVDWLSEDGRKASEKAELNEENTLAGRRDSAREWLVENGGNWMGIEYRSRLGAGGIWSVRVHHKRVRLEPTKWHADYDLALIAAVLATESK